MFLLAIQAAPASFDAIVAAPNSHRVLLEDDTIRVLRVEVAPGATEHVHDHQWPSVTYLEQPQPITYIAYKLVDGKPVETKRFDAHSLAKSQTVKGEPEGLHAAIGSLAINEPPPAHPMAVTTPMNERLVHGIGGIRVTGCFWVAARAGDR